MLQHHAVGRCRWLLSPTPCLPCGASCCRVIVTACDVAPRSCRVLPLGSPIPPTIYLRAHAASVLPQSTLTSSKPSSRAIPRLGSRSIQALVDHLPSLVILLCASVAVTLWYGDQELVWGVDATHPMNLSEVSRYFHIPDAGLGAPDTRKLPFILPAASLLALWSILGLPYDLEVVQPLVIVGLLVFAGWSSYFLVRTLFPAFGKLAALGGGLLYMFNLYSLTMLWSTMSYLSFHYAFLPVVVTAWLLALTREGSLWLAPPVAALWALTLTPAYIATPVAVTDLALFVSILLYAALHTRRIRGVFLRGALIGGTWLTLNLFWILPFIAFAGAEYARGLSSGDPLELFALNSAPFDEAVGLGGYWGIADTYAGSLYFPWSPYFASFGATAALAIPLVALIGLLGVARSRRLLRRGGRLTRSREPVFPHFTFFVILLIAALILMTGVHEPLGGLKQWIFGRSGFAGPFRSVYQRFGGYTALAYVPVVAAGIWVLGRVVRERLGQVAGVAAAGAAIVATAVVPALPMWTGSAFDRSGINPSRRITVPADYDQFTSIIEATPGDFTVVSVPYGDDLGIIALRWKQGNEGYLGVDPLRLLMRKPVVSSDPAAPYLKGLVQDVALGGARAIAALRFMNARFIVIHNDAHIDYLASRQQWIGLDVDAIDDRIEALPGMKTIYASESLRAYLWTDWQPSRFFGLPVAEPEPRRPNLGSDSRELLEPHALSSKVRRRSLPYRVDDVGRYIVDTRSLQANELLVMNQPYDESWRADGAMPVRVDPGLNGFSVGHHRNVVVSHSLDERFPLLLAVVPAALLACAGSLCIGLLGRRRDRGSPGR